MNSRTGTPYRRRNLVLLSASDVSAKNWRSVTPVPGKLFIVGDPKQAIYRFRRADIGAYEEVKQLLLRNGAVLLQLTTSFRSLPSIQAMINGRCSRIKRLEGLKVAEK
jgi:ATP-dependent helicase/nuclease subunit A